MTYTSVGVIYVSHDHDGYNVRNNNYVLISNFSTYVDALDYVSTLTFEKMYEESEAS